MQFAVTHRERFVLQFFVTTLLFVATVPNHVLAQESPTPQSGGFRGSEQASSFRGEFSDLYNEVNEYWSATFRDLGFAYRPPNIVHVMSLMESECGFLHPDEKNAYYCAADSTIYLLPNFLEEQAQVIGDYAPIVIVAHEWGHHIQNLVSPNAYYDKASELQADCLSGVFTAYADENGLLDPGDFLEAWQLALEIGDDALGLPIDNPGAHGTSEERVKALARGYGGGPLVGCDLIIEEIRDEWGDGELIIMDALSVLPHSSCFGIVGEGRENFEQLLERFSGVPDAANRIQDLGWQASAFRQFGCDGPPEGEAGWIDINIHRFANPLAAQEAVDYFTAVRLEGSAHIQGASPTVGDYSTAMSGPAVNGKDFTIYASQGSLLIRVTGVSPSGIPFSNVLSVARAVLADQNDSSQQAPIPSPPGLPVSTFLPSSPAVNHAECFQTLTEGSYTYADVVSALKSWGLGESDIEALAWQDGAYRVFTCAEPPLGRAGQIEVIIHRFGDSGSAQRVEPYFAGTQGLERNETRSCETADALVICVFGRSLTGSPLSDVAFVLQQVTSAIP